MKYRLVLLLLALGTVPAVVSFQALTHRPTERASPPTAVPSVPAPRPDFQGVAGCATQACHGGSPTAGLVTIRNAATFWLDHDRHAYAYAVLLTPRSRRIVENLAGGAAVTEAYRDARCLACHTIPQTVYLADRWETLADDAVTAELRRDGVGCEACHGASRAWIEPHTTIPWGEERRANYQKKGMIWLNDYLARAEVCVGCHVGAAADKENNLPLRDVNHDLIAAGHPRLNFELASYQEALPPHWVEKDLATPTPRDRSPAEEPRIWLAGQVRTAEAALNLLQDRATRGPWPEFAESDCYACHHDLAAHAWRQDATAQDKGRPVGSVPWNRWHVSRPFEAWLPQEGPDAELVTALQKVRDGMSRGAPTDPNRAAQARKASCLLHSRYPDAGALGSDTTLARQLVQAAKLPQEAGATGLGPLGWDDAVQYYLLLAALRRTRPHDGAHQALDTKLAELGAGLSFPRAPQAFDGPHQFRRADVTGKKLREQFDQLRQALQP